jgi:tRNA A-37 threonylcarbamoyl transferase component Bud32
VIRRIDRYELLEQVGSGGMAVVYRGRDTALDREVAVKLLHPHLAARAESRARFSREARAVARLCHPNIVEIYDYAGDAAIESYLVTEFVRGRTLRAFAEEESVGFPEVAALLARALASALVHAHSAGVIHRDLKPENVLVLEAPGRRAVKLVDFGIARILSSDEKMTMTGALVGSPNHMAPEIIEGREADARSDLFSLGTILYWLATGDMPFEAPNPTATLRRVIEGQYSDPREGSPLVSDALAAVIASTLAAEPAQRIASAASLRDALDAALAEAGLDDAEAELQAFLAEPAAYKHALRGRLVASALALAERAISAGETARGMRLLNRVLALEPDNAQVTARLARITLAARWKRRARRAGIAVVGCTALASLAWASMSALRAPPTPPAAEASLRPGAPPPGAAAPPRGAPSKSPERPARTAPTPGPSALGTPPRLAAAAPAGAAAPARASAGASAIVAVHVSPYAQRALLDGVEVARGEGRVTFRLTPGAPHRIQIEHACCFPFIKDFSAGEAIPQPLELKERLKARPARLRVEGDPMARVYVDGRLAGKAGDSQRAPLEVPVPATGENPYDAPAEMRLERDGYLPVRATVRLRAGADVTFAASGRELPVPGPAAPVSATPPSPEESTELAPAPETTRR